MTDQDKKKNKKNKELQKAIKKAGSRSFGVYSKKKKSKSDETKNALSKLEELENKYVTRPASVKPPLPEENPNSITRSGIQKRYDPTDKTQFPDKSAYDIDPFIIEENRLTPGDDDLSETDLEPFEDLRKEESLDQVQHLPEEEPDEVDELDQAEEINQEVEPGVDPTSGADAFPEHSQFELEPIVVDQKPPDEEDSEELSGEEAEGHLEEQEEDEEDFQYGQQPLAGEETIDLPFDYPELQFKSSLTEEEDSEEEKSEDEQPDLEEADLEQEEQEEQEEQDEQDEQDEAEYLEPGQDPIEQVDRLPEDSIYEMEPIVIPGQKPLGYSEEEEQDEALEIKEQSQEPDMEIEADEEPGIEEESEESESESLQLEEQGFDEGVHEEAAELESSMPLELDQEEELLEEAAQAQARQEEEPQQADDDDDDYERMPEDSIYEMEPIVIPHQERIYQEQPEDERAPLLPPEPDGPLEPGVDPLQEMESMGEDSIYEMEPIVIPNQEPVAVQEPESAPEEEILYDVRDRSTVAPTKQDVQVISAAPLLTRPEEDVVPPMQEAPPAPVEPPQLSSAPSAQSTPPAPPAAPPEHQGAPLPDLEWEDTELTRSGRQARFSEPLISLSRDNRAPGSEIETAAIAKEIATHQSMSAVNEQRIQRSLESEMSTASGIYQRPGHTLEDRYVITGIIGQGGISVVYKAQDIDTKQIVAVKTLKEHKPDVAMRFKREIETLAKLQHKNIVRAIEAISKPPDQTFLVMEHVKGISLQELIKQYGRAEHPEVIASILTQVCEGLSHAHKHKIIHRDLKGGNIVLTNVADKIVVKILDFGIAKLEDDMQRLTLEGKAMGSPLFMSPEQCKGEVLTVKSDLYSLGIVAYELITGELPVKGKSIVDVMAKHCDVNFHPKPMVDCRDDLPGIHMLDQLIAKSLETEVSQRLQTIEQFKDVVNFWIESVRNKDLDKDVPPELMYSEDLDDSAKLKMKESISEIYEARNKALATGVSYTAVKEEREKVRKGSGLANLSKGKVIGLAVVFVIVLMVLAAVIFSFIK